MFASRGKAWASSCFVARVLRPFLLSLHSHPDLNLLRSLRPLKSSGFSNGLMSNGAVNNHNVTLIVENANFGDNLGEDHNTLFIE